MTQKNGLLETHELWQTFRTLSMKIKTTVYIYIRKGKHFCISK